LAAPGFRPEQFFFLEGCRRRTVMRFVRSAFALREGGQRDATFAGCRAKALDDT